jgi:hypothetical protein
VDRRMNAVAGKQREGRMLVSSGWHCNLQSPRANPPLGFCRVER